MTRGMIMMIGASFVFAVQDGLSRYLADIYSVYLVVMIRYWFFAAFVIVLAMRKTGGLRAALASKVPYLQIFRGLLLVAEICVMVTGFVLLGLAAGHAIFATYPLMIAALAGPILGEHAGWRRWAAIGVGFIGVLIVLRPGSEAMSLAAFVPLLAAVLFALYGLMTRLVARHDSADVSFFWTGVVGAAAITCIGIWYWEPMSLSDWRWMGALCLTSVAGHWMLIRAYELSEASEVQPFAYFQLVFATTIGLTVFQEVLDMPLVLGGAIIVASGLFTLMRQRA